jgi:hypothetical protein
MMKAGMKNKAMPARAQSEYAKHSQDEEVRSRRSVGGYSEEGGIDSRSLLDSTPCRNRKQSQPELAGKKKTPIGEIGA